MSRPVHHCAHGSFSIHCAKQHEEFRLHRREYDAHQQRFGLNSSPARFDHPTPRLHSDLRRVTCVECWQAIGAMARDRGAL